MAPSAHEQLLAAACLAVGAAAGLLAGQRRRRAQARGAQIFDMDPRLLEGKLMASGAGGRRERWSALVPSQHT